MLEKAAKEFDVLVTMDQNLPYQQNLDAFDLSVIVIRSVSNALENVSPLMPKVNAAVNTSVPSNITVVES